MRYLITGATGFVGAAVTRRILSEGDQARVLVRDGARAAALAGAGAEVTVGTVGDPNDVAEAARGCGVVIHCAAVISHRASRRALRWTNIAGAENVLNAARHAGCERMVHVSCADVTLGNEDRVHWNETRDLGRLPLDEHARSKLLAEELLLSANGTGIEVTAVRPAQLWGPNDPTHLPALCREGLQGGLRLVGSGENLVASTYIDNLVDALLSAAEVEKAAGRAYYVTDGEFVDAQELYGQLSGAMGIPPPRRGPPYPLAYAMAWARMRMGGDGWWPTDVVHRGRSTHFDQQNAMTDLDWEPRVSIAEGARAVAAWVAELGGPRALAALHRAPATDASVASDIATADGEPTRP